MSRILDLWQGMTGTVLPFAGSTAPDGWLLCDGATVSRTTYPGLFSVIGTAFGAGDGSTTFKIPDLRGEFIRGLDGGRGIDSGRVLGTAQDSTKIPFMSVALSSGGTTGTLSTPPASELTANGNTYNPTGMEDRVDAASMGAYLSTTLSTSGSGNLAMYGVRPRNVAMNYIIKV